MNITERKILGAKPISFSPEGSPTGGEAWCVEFAHENGLLWGVPFPTAALWGRAAEYGFDPADVETLVDVILHESVMTDYGFAPGPSDPSFLYHVDEETARLSHLARVKRAKQVMPFVDPGKNIAVVHQHHRSTFGTSPHWDFYRKHQQTVAGIRASHGVKS